MSIPITINMFRMIVLEYCTSLHLFSTKKKLHHEDQV